MKTNTKFYRMHNIDAFTGQHIDNQYHFTKLNNETLVSDKIEYFLNEEHKFYLKHGSPDALKAFPLRSFPNLQQMTEHFQLKLHSKVKTYVQHMLLTMHDKHTLNCTLMFESETKYNQFNEIVWANSESMPHGFHNYLPTIYYSFK
tara:strand:- start:359 stop:796 length:438 start_codon:yes stop_codon:yes gene_type:complete